MAVRLQSIYLGYICTIIFSSFDLERKKERKKNIRNEESPEILSICISLFMLLLFTFDLPLCLQLESNCQHFFHAKNVTSLAVWIICSWEKCGRSLKVTLWVGACAFLWNSYAIVMNECSQTLQAYVQFYTGIADSNSSQRYKPQECKYCCLDSSYNYSNNLFES